MKKKIIIFDMFGNPLVESWEDDQPKKALAHRKDESLRTKIKSTLFENLSKSLVKNATTALLLLLAFILYHFYPQFLTKLEDWGTTFEEFIGWLKEIMEFIKGITG